MPSERLTPQYSETEQQQHLAAIDDIERRFKAAYEVGKKEDATCFIHTLAFTHPDITFSYNSYQKMPNFLLWAVAVEAALLSGEETERCYFGQVDDATFEPFTKEDLVQLLDDANALWFGTVDMKTSSDKQDGYNHIIGIVPYRSPMTPEPTYMVHDTSGHIDFKHQGIDDLWSCIEALPHSDQYMQSVFAFRTAPDRASAEELANHDFTFFIPPSSQG